MPGPYGVTPTGFNRKTVQDILADIEARQHAEISASLDLSTATPWGQNNGIFANELGIAWEMLEVCYHAFDPDQAEDFLLTSLGKLTGTERRAASYSLVTLDVGVDAGVTLLSGTHFAAVADDPTSLWTPVEDFSSGLTGGTYSVVFRAENPGPVRANAGTITVIQTPVPGWNSVNNPQDASVGREADNDATLRERREAQLTATGSATTAAIRSDILEIDGVESCEVQENDSDGYSGLLPPHSIHAIVFDGEVPAADNNEIAQAIWSSKAAGVYAYGTTSGIATDDNGVTHEVFFSRPTQVPIYIEATVVAAPGFNALGGVTGLKNYLVDELKKVHGVGQDVNYRLVDSLPLYFGGLREGVLNVTDFTIGGATGPTGTSDIPIASNELATFDTGRIGITVT